MLSYCRAHGEGVYEYMCLHLTPLTIHDMVAHVKPESAGVVRPGSTVGG